MTSAAVEVGPARFRFSLQAYVDAWELGIFDDQRVELVDGEVWLVEIGAWHGDTTFRVGLLLNPFGHTVTGMSLVSGGSLPDPDAWIRRGGGVAVEQLSPRISRWHPADVLLVVEVSDETTAADLTVKAEIYGAAGFAHYWVVTRDGVYDHSGPMATGYRTRVQHVRGDVMPVPYATGTIPVDDLIGPA